MAVCAYVFPAYKVLALASYLGNDDEDDDDGDGNNINTAAFFVSTSPFLQSNYFGNRNIWNMFDFLKVNIMCLWKKVNAQQKMP